MTEAIDWREKSNLHKWLASRKLGSVEKLENTICGHKAKDTTPLITWRREALKKEAPGDLP